MIRQSITEGLHRGVTVFKGRGGRTDAGQDILYCVVTRLEIGTVKNLVQGIDESAFVVTHPLADATGGIIKKPILH